MDVVGPGLIRGRCDKVSQHHNLERETSRGRIGDDHLSDWRETDQGDNGRRGNPTSAIAVLMKSGSWAFGMFLARMSGQ
ncbi:MAG TPA: hypothetical protein VK667_07855 [Ktedonobacteraceae bacterium]|nr:hypothetical protein [Ktedonobacteraceae bacterium]